VRAIQHAISSLLTPPPDGGDADDRRPMKLLSAMLAKMCNLDVVRFVFLSCWF
jgi:hypothetical protein